MTPKNSQEIGSYIIKARQSPRLTSLFDSFAKIARGESGMPNKSLPYADINLLHSDAITLHFLSKYTHYSGCFNSHYLASVPYILEEECRLGSAIWLYALNAVQRLKEPLNVYTLGNAEGTIARTLADLSQGAIVSLTCSPNRENKEEFFNRGAPKNAHFFLGPFIDVTLDSLKQNNYPASFSEGFDFIIEDTTFQMYGSERAEPISFVSQNLKKTGILVLIEKLRNESDSEYSRRENQKDKSFKARFFSEDQIVQKREAILNTMKEQEVTLQSLTESIRLSFQFSVVTWNSGNFYSIVASNNRQSLSTFLNLMTPPCINKDFCYEVLPRNILGLQKGDFTFRDFSADYAQSVVDVICGK